MTHSRIGIVLGPILCGGATWVDSRVRAVSATRSSSGRVASLINTSACGTPATIGRANSRANGSAIH